jgi:hypothetical protein
MKLNTRDGDLHQGQAPLSVCEIFGFCRTDQSSTRIPFKLPKMAAAGATTLELESSWTVNEQRCLDHAIASNPKIDGEDSKLRWQKIADKVPGRSLKECVSRYREIRAKLQQQVSNKTNVVSPPPPPQPVLSSIPQQPVVNVPKSQGVSVGYSPPVPPTLPPQQNKSR